jgi:hypothetical protein
MREQCLGPCQTCLHRLPKRGVQCDFESNLNVIRADSAIRRQQIRDQSRPQDHAVPLGVTRGDTEQEGIATKRRGAQAGCCQCCGHKTESAEVESRGENDASIDHG